MGQLVDHQGLASFEAVQILHVENMQKILDDGIQKCNEGKRSSVREHSHKLHCSGHLQELLKLCCLLSAQEKQLCLEHMDHQMVLYKQAN